MSKQIVKLVRKSINYLLSEKITANNETKKIIDFLIESTFYDKDDDFFEKIVKAEGSETPKYKWFNGMRYTKNESGHYRGYKGKYLHRAIWEYYNGEIPKNCIIHHIDGNPENNDIKNLQLMTLIEHRKLHNKLNEPEKYICDYCGKEFQCKRKGGRPNRFCSRECGYKWTYRNNKEIRICKECGKEFSVYKYSKNKYCSKECIAKVNSRAHLGKKYKK